MTDRPSPSMGNMDLRPVVAVWLAVAAVTAPIVGKFLARREPGPARPPDTGPGRSSRCRERCVPPPCPPMEEIEINWIGPAHECEPGTFAREVAEFYDEDEL